MPEKGFVMAMQGDLLLSTRMRERVRYGIWFIVSRFGPGGSMVAVSAGGAAGGNAPPAGLMPRSTVIGRLMDGPSVHFELLAAPPPGVSVAGAYRPGPGAVWLMGEPPHLGLFGAGDLESGVRWRLSAERRPWIGETVDAVERPITIGSRRSIQECRQRRKDEGWE